MITFDKGRTRRFFRRVGQSRSEESYCPKKNDNANPHVSHSPPGKVRLRKHNSAKSPVCASAAISSRDSILNWGVQFARAYVSRLVRAPTDGRNDGAHEKNRESDSNEKHEDD
jgi:hypothetical protein